MFLTIFQARIQEVHIMIGHILGDLVDEHMKGL